MTFFIHFSSLWPHAVQNLLLCLRSGANVPPSDTSQAPSVAELVNGLDWRLLRVALWFINILVTDVGKTDMRVAK